MCLHPRHHTVLTDPTHQSSESDSRSGKKKQCLREPFRELNLKLGPGLLWQPESLSLSTKTVFCLGPSLVLDGAFTPTTYHLQESQVPCETLCRDCYVLCSFGAPVYVVHQSLLHHRDATETGRCISEGNDGWLSHIVPVVHEATTYCDRLVSFFFNYLNVLVCDLILQK